jgi:hypothetical protein
LICLSTAKGCEGESYDGPDTMERLQALNADMDRVLREVDELRRAGRMYYRARLRAFLYRFPC